MEKENPVSSKWENMIGRNVREGEEKKLKQKQVEKQVENQVGK